MYNIGGIEFTYAHMLFTLYACFFSILVVGLLLSLYLFLWHIIDKRNKKFHDED